MYLDNFVEAGYDTLRVCEEITEEDLVHFPTITKPGHKKAILIAAKELKEMRQGLQTLFFFGQTDLLIFNLSFSTTKQLAPTYWRNCRYCSKGN